MKTVNRYIDDLYDTADPLLDEVLKTIRENGMPSISVSPSSGKFLTMLVSISGAKKILEIGALGGYSGICLARGFGQGGRLTSLELESSYAKLALSNLEKAGFEEQVSYIVGEAMESLSKLIEEKQKFDFFFIDADKPNYQNYLEACIKLAAPGALIVADNVLAGGSVADNAAKQRRYTDHMKAFNTYTANHPRLESVLVPLGDGMTIVRVTS